MLTQSHFNSIFISPYLFLINLDKTKKKQFMHEIYENRQNSRHYIRVLTSVAFVSRAFQRNCVLNFIFRSKDQKKVVNGSLPSLRCSNSGWKFLKSYFSKSSTIKVTKCMKLKLQVRPIFTKWVDISIDSKKILQRHHVFLIIQLFYVVKAIHTGEFLWL